MAVNFDWLFLNAPVAVSVAVSSVWLLAAPCPEGPGLGRCLTKSSYTVYTKQCMYKIEKSARQKTRRERDTHRVSQVVAFETVHFFTNVRSGVVSSDDLSSHYFSPSLRHCDKSHPDITIQ